MYINVSLDIRKAVAKLNSVRRDQIPFATSLALNETAKQVAQAEKDEIRRLFKSPTAYVQNSPRYTRSTKANLRASVHIRGTVARSLQAQVSGGAREQKPYERLLQGVLPSGWVTAPSRGARIDAAGNIQRSQLLQVLRTIRGSKRSKGDYFVSTPSNPAKGDRGALPWGIWQRQRRRVIQVIAFLPRAQYAGRFKFYDIATRTVRQKIGANFRAAMARAMATAR